MTRLCAFCEWFFTCLAIALFIVAALAYPVQEARADDGCMTWCYVQYSDPDDYNSCLEGCKGTDCKTYCDTYFSGSMDCYSACMNGTAGAVAQKTCPGHDTCSNGCAFSGNPKNPCPVLEKKYCAGNNNKACDACYCGPIFDKQGEFVKCNCIVIPPLKK